MNRTLPDVVRDETAPLLFAAGFSMLLLMLILTFGLVLLARRRARMNGIYTKYVTTGDRPVRRCTPRSS